MEAGMQQVFSERSFGDNWSFLVRGYDVAYQCVNGDPKFFVMTNTLGSNKDASPRTSQRGVQCASSTPTIDIIGKTRSSLERNRCCAFLIRKCLWLWHCYCNSFQRHDQHRQDCWFGNQMCRHVFRFKYVRCRIVVLLSPMCVHFPHMYALGLSGLHRSC